MCTTKKIRRVNLKVREPSPSKMLLASALLGEVNKQLGHESVAVTERRFAQWAVRLRQQIEDEVVTAVRRLVRPSLCSVRHRRSVGIPSWIVRFDLTDGEELVSW